MTPSSPSPAADKKGMSGCLIGILVLGGLLLLLLVIVGVAGVIFMRSDTGKKVVDLVGKGGKTFVKGIRAPGTAELHKLGCSTAMVVSASEVLNVIQAFTDGGAPKDVDDLIVVCQVGIVGTPPSCDDVARVYVGAPDTGGRPFVALVQQQGTDRGRCMVRYSATGENLGALDAAKKR